MKRFTIFAIFALLTGTACNKITGGENTRMAICADVSPVGSKAHQVHKYDMLWGDGDKIYVKGETAADTFTLESGQGTSRGIFVQDGTAAISGAVQAFYPASLVDEDGKMTWPTVQGREFFMPMYSCGEIARGEQTKLGFNALGSVLQIVFTTTHPNAILKSIDIQDETKALGGAFTVGENGAAVISGEGNQGVTLDLGEGTAVDMTPILFNIALPAGKYGKLTLTFTTTIGEVCTMTSNSLPELELGVVNRIAVCAKNYSSNRIYVGAPIWAEKNLGAEHPYDEGYRFTWGNVTPYIITGSFYVGNELHWIWSNAFDQSQSLPEGFTKDFYDTTPGAGLTGDIPANETYDAARKLLGGKWRIPTNEEAITLRDSCYIVFTNDYDGTGKKGCIVYKAKAKEDRGKFIKEGESPLPGYSTSDRHIFMPCAWEGSGDTYYDDSSNNGRYWTSTRDGDKAKRLRFQPILWDTAIASSRYLGIVIRPVSD